VAKSSFVSQEFGRIHDLHKLHNPKIFSKSFGMKEPLMFCANEDCVYRRESKCPAGSLKKECPNKSKLDYKNGCPFFVGAPFQNDVLVQSMNGTKPITLIITGRGTGKTAIINTQKAIMEATVEPYIRAILLKCDRPVPTKVIVVGNTKDTALLLRNSIHGALESSELLYSMVADDTKTYIRFHNGSEIFIRTAGTDGRSTRGFHADVMKNRYGDQVRCTIVYLFDEACFTRAPSIVSEVMRPSLQVGNVFSGIFVTSTPWGKSGEIYDMFDNPGDAIRVYNFASYHNKFTNLDILLDFRNRLEAAGAAPIYNREVRGIFQSEEGLYFPWVVWSRSLDDSIDWLDYEEIEALADKDVTYVGDYYLAIDPNKFRQLEEGDFSAYLLLQVSKEREHIRAISYGKYLMDIEDKFLERVKNIIRVFRPKRFMCCGNSGYISFLKSNGIDVIPGSNETGELLRAMTLAKVDMVHGIYKQPASQDWEDERRSYIPKEKGITSIPRLDHKSGWGQGYTSDLMDCLAFNYQQIIEDFGLGSLPVPEVSGLSAGLVTPWSLGEYESLVMSSSRRLDMVRR
jgi:hypothetical protein